MYSSNWRKQTVGHKNENLHSDWDTFTYKLTLTQLDYSIFYEIFCQLWLKKCSKKADFMTDFIWEHKNRYFKTLHIYFNINKHNRRWISLI